MQAVAGRTGVFAPGSEGSSHPIGATLTPDGLNVSVYAKRATGVDLLLFDDVEDDTPARPRSITREGVSSSTASNSSSSTPVARLA